MVKKYERPPREIKAVEDEETAYFFDMLERNLKKNVISTIKDNLDITFYIFSRHTASASGAFSM